MLQASKVIPTVFRRKAAPEAEVSTSKVHSHFCVSSRSGLLHASLAAWPAALCFLAGTTGLFWTGIQPYQLSLKGRDHLQGGFIKCGGTMRSTRVPGGPPWTQL